MSRDVTRLLGRSQRGWLRATDRRRTRFTPQLIRVLWLPGDGDARDVPVLGRALLGEPTDVFEGLEFWNLVPDWPVPVRVRQQTPVRLATPGWLIHLVPEFDATARPRPDHRKEVTMRPEETADGKCPECGGTGVNGKGEPCSRGCG